MATHLSNLNLNGNQLQNFVVHPLATSPTGKLGLKFFDTANKREKIYDGSAWLETAYMSDIAGVNGIASGIDTRLKAIEAYFSTEEDADSKISKWNEIVAFINQTEGTTLAGILAGYVPTSRGLVQGTGITISGASSNKATLAADRTISLATVSGLTAGTYFKTTVDSYGRVTSGSNPTTLAGFGITDAYTKTEIGNLIDGLDVVSVTQTLTSGKAIATISVGETDTVLYAPATYDWDEITNQPTIATFMGSTAIGGTSSYIYWDGTKFSTKALGGLAFKDSLGKSDVGLGNVDNLAASGYFTALSSNTTNAVSATIGGTTKSISVATMKTSLGLKALAFKDSLSASDVGATKKYAGSITKGTATSYKITHSLGTRDVIVMVYDPSTYEQVIVDTTMTDTNNITLSFGSAPTANYRVVVIG